jgi:hypothetical protein
MSGWFKRNGIAAAMILVLVPATIAVTFSTDWGTYLSSRPTQPVDVGVGHSTQFNGTQWRVADSHRISAESREGVDAGLPAGSALIVVTIEITPEELNADGKSSYCTVRLGEYDGASDDPTRTWGDAISAPIDYRIPEGTESGCSREIVDPYLVTSTFVVAGDAGDNLGVQLEVGEELPRYLLLRL